eukprot:m.55236 g.55236  ORF g.55236 m.55236 type:complete len:87 (-) comp11472_c0_seq1:2174-2434(-)
MTETHTHTHTNKLREDIPKQTIKQNGGMVWGYDNCVNCWYNGSDGWSCVNQEPSDSGGKDPQQETHEAINGRATQAVGSVQKWGRQ